jgi:DNA-binding MarR family transcriptional regulator
MAQRPSQVSGLERHIGYWLRYVSNHVSHTFGQRVEAQGVTVAEWAVMREMFEAGPVPPSQIAERLGMTRGAISKLIERLRRKKQVERSAATKDRRYQRITLTPSGKKLVPILARLADENDEEFFGHLNVSQREALVGILQDCVRRHGWKDMPVS